MIFLHKWRKVKDTGKHRYSVCDKCGSQRVDVVYSTGHQPIDHDLVSNKPKFICRKGG